MAARASLPRDALIFLASVALGAVPTIDLVVQHDGNPTALLRVGERAASRSFVEDDFGDTIVVPGLGHDGQQFYVMARTFPDMQDADGHVDRLLYRARRVLLPAVTSPLPAGEATVWAMLTVTLVAIGLAGVALARLAGRVGAPAWVGVSVALSPALFMSARATLADAMAFALALGGVVLWRTRLWSAVALFALAALARETTLVVPLACLLFAERRQRLPLLTPFAVYALWVLGTSVWLDPVLSQGTRSPVDEARRLFGPPFAAWWEVGLDSPPILLAALLGAASIVAAWRLRPHLPEVAAWLLADVVLLVLARTGVAEDLLNFTRVVPLAVPGLALAVSAGTRKERRAV